MIVVTVVNCPVSLRGDLTKWLQEINVGVYVGAVNAKIREQLWKRIVNNIKKGQATMVYTTNNEQKYDFKVHNTNWIPINFDGVRLMLRPNTEFQQQKSDKLKTGFSKAAKKREAKRWSKKIQQDVIKCPPNYVVLDIETTGFSFQHDDIIELGAIKIENGLVIDQIGSLIKTDKKLNADIVALTGITEKSIQEKGKELSEFFPGFLEFISDNIVVCHNADFDYGFLRTACRNLGYKRFTNPRIDTLELAKEIVHDVQNHQLSTLAGYFSIEVEQFHRSINDCIATHELLNKLIKFGQVEKFKARE